MYRINFNGQQVSGTFTTHAEAAREIRAVYASCGGTMWIQEYCGDGEWSGAGLSAAKRRPHLHAA